MNRRSNDPISPQVKRVPFDLLARSEGHILLTGCGLALLYFFWVGVQGYASPESFRMLLGMTATNVVFGRAAGISFGYLAEKIHPIVVVVANMWIETVLVLLIYPLFVFSWEQLIEIRGLRRLMARTRKVAETHQPLIHKYGIIGLFAFVWLPFWMTGPVVGCVIGFLIGLRPWLNIAIVLGGTYLAAVVWAVVLREMHERIAVYGAYAPLLILVLIIATVMVGNLLQRRREKKDAEQDRL